MPSPVRWGWGLVIVAMLTIVPFYYYRWEYTHSKRLRPVVEGKVYRSGQLTAPGFIEAVDRYHFHTIINLQDDVPDPDVALGYFTRKTIKESELCRQLGVRYVFVAPDLISRKRVPHDRPPAIDQFLAIMDDPATYPVLLHCRAGLHRTGIMAAIYRMEYQGWSHEQAIAEMKAHGFGEWPCTTANDYIMQYIATFQRGLRQNPSAGDMLRDHKWNDWVHHQ
jgi:tyrosine-protein phosphatase SIW14